MSVAANPVHHSGVVPALPLALRAEGFAAVIKTDAGEDVLGQAAGDDKLPKALRRRLSEFDLMAARCIAGLAEPGRDEEIVFASRYGNMAITFDLLNQIAADELLSPARFSMSVHNAAAGSASQIAVNRAGHTAVAALGRTFTAGLTEAWARLADGSPSVIFAYADMPLMQPYSPHDEPGPGVALAVRFRAGSSGGDHRAEDGRTGVASLARALAAGAGGVTWRF